MSHINWRPQSPLVSSRDEGIESLFWLELYIPKTAIPDQVTFQLLIGCLCLPQRRTLSREGFGGTLPKLILSAGVQWAIRRSRPWEVPGPCDVSRRLGAASSNVMCCESATGHRRSHHNNAWHEQSIISISASASRSSLYGSRGTTSTTKASNFCHPFPSATTIAAAAAARSLGLLFMLLLCCSQGKIHTPSSSPSPSSS